MLFTFGITIIVSSLLLVYFVFVLRFIPR